MSRPIFKEIRGRYILYPDPFVLIELILFIGYKKPCMFETPSLKCKRDVCRQVSK